MSKTYPTFKFTHRDYTRKDGSHNIFLRLTINRKVKYFPLNVFSKPDHFKKGIITKADPDHENKNSLIKLNQIKTDKIIFDYRIQDKTLTFTRFQNDFFNGAYCSDSFYDFYEQQIQLFKNSLSISSINNYRSQLQKLKEYRKELAFDDIDKDFITAYKGFLIKEKSNNENTVIKSLAIIKVILNKAIEHGKIKENPFSGYKLGKIEGDRHFLSQEELSKLERLYYGNSLPANKNNVLRYFLFCCYTGLRYQDVKKLRFRDIQDNKYLHLEMIKTKEFVRIPLTEKARALIPKSGFDNQAVFKVFTGQPTNRYLKEIMKSAAITKQISFHCARHTFATVSKSMGIDYDVISKMLGHTDIKTTKIYTRYEMDYLSKEMEKWDN